MALARVTNWNSGDTLTAAALNGEFDNILNNAVSLLSPWTANMDANNKQLQNHVLEKLSAAATAATEGRLYYRTDTDVLEYDTSTAIRSVPNFAHSGGRLTLSGSSLLLAPVFHNLLPINGRLEVIPDAGASLAIGAAAASTAYNIYAYMSGSTMTLEFSATATAVQAGTGVTIKSGDATRTFVGSVTTSPTPTWTRPVSFFNPTGPTDVLKTADETVNASDTLQDDDVLRFPVAVSEKVSWRAVLFCDSGTTPDIKFAFTWPAAATIARWVSSGSVRVDATGVVVTASQVSVSGTAQDYAGFGAGTISVYVLEGYIENGANAGSVVLQWAQNTSNASDTKVRAGSRLEVTRHP
jgi:hypothetical protein